MKRKLLAFLCLLLLLLSGCKIELPDRGAQTGPSSAPGTISAGSPSSSGESAQSGSPASVSAGASSSPASSGKSSAPGKPAPAQPGSSSRAPSAAGKPASRSAASNPGNSAGPSSASPQKTELRCTFSISCADILKNKSRFSAENLSIVPRNGAILGQETVSFQKGDSVFDLLLRETKQRGIPMDHLRSPVFQTEYVRGIANIYEKSPFGTNSGWTYRVDGKTPNVGSSTYRLKGGERVEWIFVCGR